MTKARKPPSRFASVFLLLLSGAAIIIGLDAIVSETATTASMHGEDKRVHGIETVYVGIGWIMFGIAFANKVIASHMGLSYERFITIGLGIVGGLSWALVFI